MGPYTHLIEKELELHRQELMRQAETERLLRQVPRNQRSMIRGAAGKLGILLLKLGARLKQFGQSPTLLEDHL
ncbi:MAG TPA: hypothetical protein VEI53_13130 [Ktedonobacteraceae bacterium]|nr:hypothetical protein [Ktedonobacteraceae bacterium]